MIDGTRWKQHWRRGRLNRCDEAPLCRSDERPPPRDLQLAVRYPTLDSHRAPSACNHHVVNGAGLGMRFQTPFDPIMLPIFSGPGAAISGKHLYVPLAPGTIASGQSLVHKRCYDGYKYQISTVSGSVRALRFDFCQFHENEASGCFRMSRKRLTHMDV